MPLSPGCEPPLYCTANPFICELYLKYLSSYCAANPSACHQRTGAKAETARAK